MPSLRRTAEETLNDVVDVRLVSIGGASQVGRGTIIGEHGRRKLWKAKRIANRYVRARPLAEWQETKMGGTPKKLGVLPSSTGRFSVNRARRDLERVVAYPSHELPPPAFTLVLIFMAFSWNLVLGMVEKLARLLWQKLPNRVCCYRHRPLHWS